MNMKPLVPVFLASVCVGHALGYVQRIAPTAQAQTQGAPRDPNALPPAIAPVPTPPLYPDPPQGPAHWNIEDIRKIFEARRTAAKANPDQGFGGAPVAPGTPSFQGQTFRTHWMTGLLYRAKYTKPRPSNVTGRMSMYDDADQHQGATDFYVVTGGGGRMIVGGVIENREYGRMPPAYNPATATIQPLRPGEFNGQPIVGGEMFDGKAGDWVVIPPNTPHWWQVGDDGMGYLMMKVNIGTYPRGLIH
jgi:quercetin dioxygenase-like cupin family protein